MKTILPTLFFCIVISQPAFSQTIESGDILDKITDIINDMPGNSGNQYQAPSTDDLDDWEVVLAEMFAQDYAAADAAAGLLGYDLVEFSDNPTGETYYILEKLQNSLNYWGTYVWNPNPERDDVVLMAPHPKFDFNTGKQAIYCFQNIDAFFFMMAGTHRCNNSTSSSCSGTTTACGGSAPYRISDMAHVVNAIWQRTTEYLFDNFGGTNFIQLHGFSMEVGDPYVIMSNGTRDEPNPDLVVAIRDELDAIDPVLTFEIAHLNHNWNRLIGFSNTNGRYINSSNNICNSNATVPSGRFIHIEQERTRLRDNVNGWHKMAMALAETFPGPPLAPLPVELSVFQASLMDGNVLLEWQTHSEVNNDFFEIEKSTDGYFFQKIGQVEGEGMSSGLKRYEFIDLPVRGQNYYRLRQVDLDGTAEYSAIVQVYFHEQKLPEVSFRHDENILVVSLDSPLTGGSANIRLFDGLGRLILISPLDEGQTFIPVFSMGTQLYFFQIENERAHLGSGIVFLRTK
jgi:hypothetical protein